MGVIPIVERNGSWADMFSALGVTVLDDWRGEGRAGRQAADGRRGERAAQRRDPRRL